MTKVKRDSRAYTLEEKKKFAEMLKTASNREVRKKTGVARATLRHIREEFSIPEYVRPPAKKKAVKKPAPKAKAPAKKTPAKEKAKPAPKAKAPAKKGKVKLKKDLVQDVAKDIAETPPAEAAEGSAIL